MAESTYLYAQNKKVLVLKLKGFLKEPIETVYIGYIRFTLHNYAEIPQELRDFNSY